MKPVYPLTYRAAELPAYNANTLRALLSLRISNRSIQSLESGQLLIKMEAAPCNPSDIAFMQGGYNVVKPLPAVPGFEGSGMVADVAGDVDKSWIGKRVSVFVQGDGDGSWAEYVVATVGQLLPSNQGLSAEQVAMFFVNPFTAFGLIEAAQAHACSGIILNAAGSRLSAWVLALAREKGIAVSGIVRKQQTAEALAGKGFARLLVSTADDFDAQLKQAMNDLQPNVFLDAVAGEQTGLVANILPTNSKVIVYGGLSGKEVAGINPLQLIFRKLSISGFDLNAWFASAGNEKIAQVSRHLAQLIAEGKVETPVSIQIGLDELVKGLRHYLGAMSEGKMLIRF